MSKEGIVQTSVIYLTFQALPAHVIRIKRLFQRTFPFSQESTFFVISALHFTGRGRWRGEWFYVTLSGSSFLICSPFEEFSPVPWNNLGNCTLRMAVMNSGLCWTRVIPPLCHLNSGDHFSLSCLFFLSHSQSRQKGSPSHPRWNPSGENPEILIFWSPKMPLIVFLSSGRKRRKGPHPSDPEYWTIHS